MQLGPAAKVMEAPDLRGGALSAAHPNPSSLPGIQEVPGAVAYLALPATRGDCIWWPRDWHHLDTTLGVPERLTGPQDSLGANSKGAGGYESIPRPGPQFRFAFPLKSETSRTF